MAQLSGAVFKKTVQWISPMRELLSATREREAKLARMEATLAEPTDAVPQRLAIMPGWVRQEFEAMTGLLTTHSEDEA